MVALDKAHLLLSPDDDGIGKLQRSQILHPSFVERDSVVGNRERIDPDVADALVTRLHAGGLELHRARALALSEEARGCIDSAIDELDAAIHLIRLAATNFDNPQEST
jgi:hypothetical protein